MNSRLGYLLVKLIASLAAVNKLGGKLLGSDFIQVTEPTRIIGSGITPKNHPEPTLKHLGRHVEEPS